jgi:hypothetical protein
MCGGRPEKGATTCAYVFDAEPNGKAGSHHGPILDIPQNDFVSTISRTICKRPSDFWQK